MPHFTATARGAGSDSRRGDALDRPRVSIVVATFNRADRLNRCLQSVARVETRGEFDAELILVDNASTDHTPAVVESFAADSPLPTRYVHEANPGVACARNRGVEEATGDWVCFFDDDQTARPDWVWRLLTTAQREGVPCVGGARDLVIEGGRPAPGDGYCRQLLGEWPPSMPPSDFHSRWLPNTGNVLVHRRVFDEVGVFNEQAVEGGEDTEFFRRVLTAGFRGRFTPDALVQHHIPADRTAGAYLQWVARRHGMVAARCDLVSGRAWLACNLAARLAHTAVVRLPRWAALRLAGRSDRSLGAFCRVRKTQGYAQWAMQSLLSAGQAGRELLGTHHRESARVAAGHAAGEHVAGGQAAAGRGDESSALD